MQKLTLAIISILAVACLGVGVIVGYFVSNRKTFVEPHRFKRSCGPDHEFFIPSVKSNLEVCFDKCRSGACQAESCQLEQPRSYVAYHLRGKQITVDGRLTEKAWTDVPFTEEFVDLRGSEYTKPFFKTQVKIRWDEENLYVGAMLQEDDIWANKTVHDSRVYLDNAFEIYVDTDGTTHNYKEFQINALETTWDLMLTKAYIDGGSAVSSWESNAEHKVYTVGNVNDPISNNEYWSVELKLPFNKLRENNLNPTGGAPDDKDIWRIVLARPEWSFNIVNGAYVKDESADASWWAWQPHGAVNLHLPDKWGLLQFSRAEVGNAQFTPNEEWKISQALFDTFNAMKKYFGEFGLYTADIKMLDLPHYLLEGICVGIPQIAVSSDSFNISIAAKTGVLQGHIRNDRYLWFGDKSAGLQTGR